MGAHSTKSRGTTSSLDNSLHTGRHENPDSLHLTKSLSSLPNKCLPDFKTGGDIKKSKENESKIKSRISCGPDMREANHKLPNDLASLSSTEVKPLYIANPVKINERSTAARISSKVYL